MPHAHAIQHARMSCARFQGFAEDVQLSASSPHKRLGIACEPHEGNGLSAPCLHEHFFHFPNGFENMDAARMAEALRPEHVDPFVQCRLRTQDEQWPTLELDTALQRTSNTHNMSDVMRLLGSRRVAMVGASLVRQLHGALQCALAGAGLRRDHELQWRHWGWATFTHDNRGCADVSALRHGAGGSSAGNGGGEGFVQRLEASGCVSKGTAFRELLESSDVVIIAYNPQHYEGLLDWWRYDLRQLLPPLEHFAQQPGKLAIIREPPAQHFERGQYMTGRRQWVSPERGCCTPVPADLAHANYNWDAVVAVHEEVRRLAPSVRVLPWYNATLRRHAAHIGTRAACMVHNATMGAWTRRGECPCDCTHFCFTPLFYDATILTPLYHMLAKKARTDRVVASGSVGGHLGVSKENGVE
jgi:hypothetical protein